MSVRACVRVCACVVIVGSYSSRNRELSLKNRGAIKRLLLFLLPVRCPLLLVPVSHRKLRCCGSHDIIVAVLQGARYCFRDSSERCFRVRVWMYYSGVPSWTQLYGDNSNPHTLNFESIRAVQQRAAQEQQQRYNTSEPRNAHLHTREERLCFPFSTCDTLVISSQLHPEGEPCSVPGTRYQVQVPVYDIFRVSLFVSCTYTSYIYYNYIYTKVYEVYVHETNRIYLLVGLVCLSHVHILRIYINTYLVIISVTGHRCHMQSVPLEQGYN